MTKAVTVTKADLVRAFTTWRKEVAGGYSAAELLADNKRPPELAAKSDAEYFFSLLDNDTPCLRH